MLGVKSQFPGFGKKGVVATVGVEENDNSFTTITNDTYKGKWVVLYFYPKDFTFVCPTEIVEFDNLYGDFADNDAQLLGASVDNEFVHRAWRNSHDGLKKIKTPLIADVSRELSSQLGILDPEAGVSQRALFIIDPDNIIRFTMVTDLSVGRNSKEVLRILQALQSDELCPCNWQAGDPTL